MGPVCAFLQTGVSEKDCALSLSCKFSYGGLPGVDSVKKLGYASGGGGGAPRGAAAARPRPAARVTMLGYARSPPPPPILAPIPLPSHLKFFLKFVYLAWLVKNCISNTGGNTSLNLGIVWP